MSELAYEKEDRAFGTAYLVEARQFADAYLELLRRLAEPDVVARAGRFFDDWHAGLRGGERPLMPYFFSTAIEEKAFARAERWADGDEVDIAEDEG